MRTGAPRLLTASAGYIAAQVALLDVSLHTVGLHPPLTVVIMAAAIERLGTLIPITPGGTGVAEVGAIAWLVGTGSRRRSRSWPACCSAASSWW